MMHKKGGEYGLTLKDSFWIILIIAIYGIISFINLGSLKNPQTFWNPLEEGNYAVVGMAEPTAISNIRYFSGVRFGSYELYGSNDNKSFDYIGTLKEDKVFFWQDFNVNRVYQYIALKAIDEEVIMGELGIYNELGELVTIYPITDSANRLVDESDTVPENISYLNSTYFDEVYHARTAYEYMHDLEIYEWTHPPLGKLIMTIPMNWLGMTPFSYRLMGNVAGTLMLIVIYIFGKRLFGETKYAAVAAILLAADGMHFVQTRIGTVDSFLVLFILLAYLFMYQYVSGEDNGPLVSKMGNLFASGLFMGAAIATKWNGTYCAIGLAIIFFINFFIRLKNNTRHSLWREQAPKIFWSCFIFFIIVPIAVYLCSYIPFMLTYEGNIFVGLWELQKRMYYYHADLEATHPFSSPWYLWPLTIKPVWYYDGQVAEGMVSSIALHANPILWWSGIIGILYSFKEAIIDRNKKYVFLSVAILAVYVPYVLIPRIMYLYHYFPVVPLMILALVGLLKALVDKFEKNSILILFTLIIILVFAFFYPIYSGFMIPSWYANLTEWLPQWQLF